MYLKTSSEHNAANDCQPEDRRHLARRHLIYYLRAWDASNSRLIGHVVDITTNGLMLISEEPIGVGEEYHLEVRLPNQQGMLQPMRFKAVCRWSNNDINKSFFDSGFEILEQSSDAVKAIQGMINAYGFGA